jgi:hypothetical protein
VRRATLDHPVGVLLPHRMRLAGHAREIEIPGGSLSPILRGPPRLCGESPLRTPEKLSLTLALRLCLRVAAIGQSGCKSLTREIQPPIQQKHHSESGRPGRFC